jgi:ankyrin repeat protein
MTFEKLRTGSQLPGRDSRRAARLLLLSLSIAFVFVLHTTLALGDDAAKARKKLYDEYIPFTPEKFFHYVFMNNVEIVELFLEGGISLDSADSLGRRALHIASGREDGVILGLLLEYSANVNQGDKKGTTPLCVAADDGHLDNVKKLLDARADINAQCGADKNTSLHMAATQGHGSVVELLIQSGAALESQNRLLNTPLHAVVLSNNKSILQLFIKSGANVAARDRTGNTPLHIAVNRQYAGMVKTLLDAGAPLEARNKRGATPLWVAANFDAAEIAQLLIDAGADTEAKAADGMTPMQIAENARSVRVIEILKTHRK